MARHPNLNVELKSLPHNVGLLEEKVAVEIRLKHDDHPALNSKAIMPIYVTPIASESYLHNQAMQSSTLRLVKLPIKFDISKFCEKKADCEIAKADELYVDNYQSVLSAVRANLGVGMRYFSDKDRLFLKSSLVKLCPDKEVHLGELYLVCLKKNAHEKVFVDFKNWVQELGRRIEL